MFYTTNYLGHMTSSGLVLSFQKVSIYGRILEFPLEPADEIILWLNYIIKDGLFY